MENTEIKRKVLKKLHQAMMGGDLQPLLQIRIMGSQGNLGQQDVEEQEEPGEEMEEAREESEMGEMGEGDMASFRGDPELAEIIRRKKRERGEY